MVGLGSHLCPYRLLRRLPSFYLWCSPLPTPIEYSPVPIRPPLAPPPPASMYLSKITALAAAAAALVLVCVAATGATAAALPPAVAPSTSAAAPAAATAPPADNLSLLFTARRTANIVRTVCAEMMEVATRQSTPTCSLSIRTSVWQSARRSSANAPLVARRRVRLRYGRERRTMHFRAICRHSRRSHKVRCIESYKTSWRAYCHGRRSMLCTSNVRVNGWKFQMVLAALPKLSTK